MICYTLSNETLTGVLGPERERQFERSPKEQESGRSQTSYPSEKAPVAIPLELCLLLVSSMSEHDRFNDYFTCIT